MQLTITNINEIKNIIKQNVEERKYTNSMLTDEFIHKEFTILLKHINLKHSHHIDSHYSYENYEKIKQIINNSNNNNNNDI